MKHKSSPSASGSDLARQLFLWLSLAAMVAALAWWLWPVAPAPTPLADSPAASGAGAKTTAADFAPLVGKWQRSDGDYLIEILSAAADGTLEAKYYNPRPIIVGKAMGVIDGGKLSAIVELRDVDYPGSTYRLRHAGDKMSGDYFQATQGETFQVEFSRVP